MAEGTCSIEECGLPAFCRSWCRKHYQRWYVHGDPRHLGKRPNGTISAMLQLGAAATTDDCVMMSGTQHRAQANLNGAQMYASRAVWILANGDPGVLSVLHTCHRGEEGCINIRHLYLGDQAQNMLDMDRAGRRRGGAKPQKLTDSQVAEIRRRHMRGVNHIYPSNTVALAEEFGVSKTTIVNIVAGRVRRSAHGCRTEIARLAAELERSPAGEAAGATPAQD